MEIFLDSADMAAIKHCVEAGIIDGVTTNPSLIKKAMDDGSHSMEEHIVSILKIMGKRPVSLEVAGGSATEMYKQGKALYKRFSKDSNIVVIKIPVNPTVDEQHCLDEEGFKVIRRLSKEGIPVNVTLIFTPEQAMLAAKAGARYVSPFVGRIDDKIRADHGVDFDKKDYFPAYGWDHGNGVLEDHGVISGIDLVRQIADIFAAHDITTKVLAASLRSARQVREAALVNADAATVPYAVIDAMLRHPKTLEGMQKFTEDTIPEYRKLME